MSGYVWKGTPAPAPVAPQQTTDPRRPELCGTYPGYAQHHRHGQEACGPCNTANNEYNRKITRNPDGTLKLVRTPFDDSACGTYKGYRRHTRRGLGPCDRCRAAYNGYNNAYKAKRRELAAGQVAA